MRREEKLNEEQKEPMSRQFVLSDCGHALQIEKARQVNPLVARFHKDRLKTTPKALSEDRFLSPR